MSGLPLWPTVGAAGAAETDRLFIGLLLVTGAAAGLVFLLLTVFAVRYRAGSTARRSGPPEKSWRWEIGWTTASLLVFLGLFVWGADLYLREAAGPVDAPQVFVVAKQWMWQTQHAGGQREINELHLPAATAVRLEMISQDVIHSFFVPAFRIKRDVLPGRYQTLWLPPAIAGTYPLLCAEFCGTDHAVMGGRIVVMEPADFAAWLARGRVDRDLVAQGRQLFQERGCSGCHDPGSRIHAPSLAGLYGSPVPLADGRVVVADERYLRDSILMPRAEIAAGYPPVMPSFAGQLGEDDIARLIAYLRSLATARATP